MTNLLWPGDQRAGEHMTDRALLHSMVAVESAWLSALGAAGLVPVANVDLGQLVGETDCEWLDATAEGAGNPVVGLVALLRQRAAPALSPWIHRGLSSQDIVDTALMLMLRGVIDDIGIQLATQISTLCTLATAHRGAPMVARTLSQQAAPTTFGAKVASWLNGVLDAQERLGALSTPVQFGGAVGNWSGTVELARLRTGATDPAELVERVGRSAATTLGLDFRLPWLTARAPITTAADALVACTDSWGRIASDIVILARPEIGELSEPAIEGRGKSSSMPHKRNPILSILIRRAALATPPLAAALHIAAALANDDRPDGAWHAEWDTLRILARRTVVAGSQCAELLTGLQVHVTQMARNLEAADVLGEQRTIAGVAESQPSATYFGAVELLVDESLRRARRALSGER